MAPFVFWLVPFVAQARITSPTGYEWFRPYVGTGSYTPGTVEPAGTSIALLLPNLVSSSNDSGSVTVNASLTVGDRYHVVVILSSGDAFENGGGGTFTYEGGPIVIPLSDGVISSVDPFYGIGISDTSSSFSIQSISATQPPSAPSSLQVEGGSLQSGVYDVQGSATLVWQSVSNATSYDVYEDGSRIASGVTSTSYSFSGIAVGSTHRFSVSAVNASGESPPSSYVTVLGVGVPQVAPTGVSVSNISSGSADVSWNAVAGATSYAVFLNGVQVGTSQGTSYALGSLKQGSTYSVSVAGVNQYGLGSRSSPVSFTTLTLSAPTGLVVGAGDKSVTASWTPVQGATNYEVYVNGSAVTQTTVPYVTVTGLSNGVSVAVSVVAMDGSGNQSSQSAAQTVTPHPPPVPVNGLGAIGGGDELKFVWSGTEAPFSGVVMQGSTVISRFTTSANSYVVTGLKPSTAYSIQLTDAGANQVSGSFNTGSVVALIPPQPPVPTSAIQSLLDDFGPAGRWLLVVLGAAVGLGICIWLSIYFWRVVRRWLSRSDVVLETWNSDLDGYGFVDSKGRLHITDVDGYRRWRDLNNE